MDCVASQLKTFLNKRLSRSSRVWGAIALLIAEIQEPILKGWREIKKSEKGLGHKPRDGRFRVETLHLCQRRLDRGEPLANHLALVARERGQQPLLTFVDIAQCISQQGSIAQSGIGANATIRRHVMEGVA